jgi:hypothetical protein
MNAGSRTLCLSPCPDNMVGRGFHLFISMNPDGQGRKYPIGLDGIITVLNIHYGFLLSYADTLPAFEQFPLPFLSLSAMVQ